MYFARGTPWTFIAANAAAVVFVLGLGTAPVFAPGDPNDEFARLVLRVVGAAGVGWVALLVLFFRDPEREVGEGVVAPADGRVTAAQSAGGRAAFSIFLGLQNVHVIRSPLAAAVTSIEHIAGAKRLAFSKESAHNERVRIGLQGEGARATLTLIAGAFADRIETYVASGQSLSKGERLGLIKFGSRADLEYEGPEPVRVVALVGNTVIAGRSPLLLRAEGGDPT